VKELVTSAEIAVVTVQFGNPDDTAALVSSLASLDGVEHIELMVVDNAKQDTRNAGLPSAVPFAVRYLAPAANLYYWGGAAFALDAIRADRASFPRWVVICNNDIVIPDPGFVNRLVSLDPEAYPIIAPEIISHATGKRQNPLLASPPTFRQRLKWRVYDLGFPIATAMLRVHRLFFNMVPARGNTRHDQRERDIYAPHGACVILSSAFFERGGSLDTSVPMFAEELTLAATAARLGMAVRYVPSLRVVHREHSTTGPHLTREKYRMERSARRRYYSIVARRR
jgi:GT2 family glycosyltransferase